MKYTPKELTGNVNVSPGSRLKDFFVLTGGLLAIVLGVYILLGLAVNLVVPRVPPEVERKLANVFSMRFAQTDTSARGRKLQQMLDTLVAAIPLQPNPYRVKVVQTSQVNALALPGGQIIMFSGLLDETKSQEEIAFVLAHELGHFANRDHLRGIGRALVMITLSTTLLGQDNPVSAFFSNQVKNAEMKFSQRQELAADRYALNLFFKTYGHVSGSTEFIKRLSTKEKNGKLVYYFASHPHPKIRLKALEKLIQEKESASP